jgi:fibronectin type 3 domain-containing protein
MKQLILPTLAATLLFLSGCTNQPTAPAEPQIDPSLPQVRVNGHLETMNSIAFEWKPLPDARVEGYHVYRDTPESSDKKLNRHASVESRYASHYTDENLQPNTTYTYRFSAYNDKMQESTASKSFRVTTHPVLSSVSFFDSIGNLPRQAKLIWRPHDNAAVNAYVLERQLVEKAEWEKIATIKGRLQAEYIDKELDDNRVYKYRLRAVTFDGIHSTPSDIAKVVTKPLPKEIQGLQASTDQPKQITLTWQASPEEDIAYYNIYRAESSNGSYDYYIKLNETRFVDEIKEDGKNYFYKVTAVDKDGLESQQQSAAINGTTLVKPNTPTLIDAIVNNNAAVLSWKNNDSRTRSYTVIKTTKESWYSSSTQEITGIKGHKFTVVDLKPDTAYQFQIMAVDANDITSEPTKAVDVLFSTPDQ